LREDSGGAGRRRGGCGTTYGFTVWSDAIVSCLGDRADAGPFGVAGGGEARPNVDEFRTGGKRWLPEFRGKQEKQILHSGEGMDVQSPCGGGFGDPLTREIEAIEADLNLGYVSRRTAEDDYGAVIAEVKRFVGYDRYRVDPEATARRRADLRKGRQVLQKDLREAR
jgi:N-methylhydantoinase B